MSSLKHPVGPQPSRVYWRRRLVVGLAALAIVVVILLIVFAPRGKSDASAPVSSHTTARSTSTSSPKPTTEPTAVPTTTATASGKACAASAVDVEAITDSNSYSADAHPQLSFSVTNTGTQPCVFDAGTAKQVFTVTSGNEVYWKSTDCQTDPVSTMILLQPGKTLTSNPITWDRTRSDPSTCKDASREAVPAAGASYHLKVQVDGVTSKTTKQFLLY
jgi:archaellum component FlaG (FlaF/FlaG flagellin family)